MSTSPPHIILAPLSHIRAMSHNLEGKRRPNYICETGRLACSSVCLTIVSQLFSWDLLGLKCQIFSGDCHRCQFLSKCQVCLTDLLLENQCQGFKNQLKSQVCSDFSPRDLLGGLVKSPGAKSAAPRGLCGG